MVNQLFSYRPLTREEVKERINNPELYELDVKRLAIDLHLRTHQVDRLQKVVSLLNDGWAVEDLLEENLEPYDLRNLP